MMLKLTITTRSMVTNPAALPAASTAATAAAAAVTGTGTDIAPASRVAWDLQLCDDVANVVDLADSEPDPFEPLGGRRGEKTAQ